MLFIRAILIAFFVSCAHAAELNEEQAEVARLQIFLDQQGFGPGVIDGKMGTYTQMAIDAYNTKFGRDATKVTQIQAEAAEQVPLLFATAIIPSVANQFVDSAFRYGNDRNYQASRSNMPYRSIAEFMAERYHTSVAFLRLINGANTLDNAGVRNALLVPNVAPFRIENMAEGRTYKKDTLLSTRWAVVDTTKHQIRIYEAIENPTISEKSSAATDTPQTDTSLFAESPDEAPVDITAMLDDDFPLEQLNELANQQLENVEELPLANSRAVIIEGDPEPEQELTPHDEHRAIIVPAYPITPGKPQFIRYGTWKMVNSIEFPTWRYDASLLKTGVRSKQSLTIPAGPNNPVGVHWMGLSRRGIGIHGTDNPDKIGRGRSAGCIRMANWDVVKLPQLIRPGATVIIK